MAVKKATEKTANPSKKKKTTARAKKGVAHEFSSINLKLSPSEVCQVYPGDKQYR